MAYGIVVVASGSVVVVVVGGSLDVVVASVVVVVASVVVVGAVVVVVVAGGRVVVVVEAGGWVVGGLTAESVVVGLAGSEGVVGVGVVSKVTLGLVDPLRGGRPDTSPTAVIVGAAMLSMVVTVHAVVVTMVGVVVPGMARMSSSSVGWQVRIGSLSGWAISPTAAVST
jgi:hypothetical protein